MFIFALGLVTIMPAQAQWTHYDTHAAPARQCDGVRLHCAIQRMAIQGHQV